MEKNKTFTKYNRWLDILIILAVSLVPLIWTSGGRVILGHDAGTPLAPSVHFLDRLFTWTHRYGLGADQSFAVAGFFIHGFEYVLDVIGLSVSQAQAVSFSVYMAGMGFAAYYLAKTFFPKQRFLPLLAGVFYQFNHFTLQAWFIAERTKFTTYIALPLLLSYIYLLSKDGKKPIRYALYTSFLLFFLNGGGFIPLFGAIFVCAPLLIILLLVSSANKLKLAKKYLSYSILTAIFSVPLHAYWLLPYITYLRTAFGHEVAKSGGINGVIGWIAAISEHTSFINLFRLQGIHEWYVNEYHQYAHIFLNDGLLVLVSYLLPIAAFWALTIAKKTERKKIFIFCFIALVSQFFMAGSHPPFGRAYIFLVKYLPGFIAFRTPFLKFAPGLWLAYAVLISFSFSKLLENRFTKIPVLFKKIALTLIIISYSFPFLTTIFFKYYEDRSTLVKVPEQVHEYANWTQTSDFPFRRLLLLPGQHPHQRAEQTTWGYWSLASLTSLLDTHSYVDRSTSLHAEESLLVEQMYKLIDNNDPRWLDKAEVLNIDGILLRSDITQNSTDHNYVSADSYREKIESNPLIKLEKSFGDWSVWRLENQSSPIRLANGYLKVKDYRSFVSPLLSVPLFNLSDNKAIFEHDTSKMESLKKADIIFPQCTHCTTTTFPGFKVNRQLKVIPGSRFYKLKLWLENKERSKQESIQSIVLFETQILMDRLNELEQLYTESSSRDAKNQGWQLYTKQLDRLKKEVQNYNKSEAFSHGKNDFLSSLHSQLTSQEKQLRGIIQFIDHIPEATDFNEVTSKIKNLSNFVLESSFFTLQEHEKKYVVPIETAGEYKVFLRPNSMNQPRDEENLEIDFIVDGVSYQSPFLPDTEWLELATLDLEKKSYRFTLFEEKDTFIDSIVDESKITLQRLEQTTNQRCSSLPIGELQKGQYRLELKISSPSGGSVISTFLDSDTFTDPFLPYWGQTVKLKDSNFTSVYRNLKVSSPQFYSFKICQLVSPIPNDLVVKEMNIKHISQPEIVFIRENPQYQDSGQRNINLNIKNQTEYQVKISPGDKSLLLFDQRYHLGWKALSSVDIPQQLKINRYSNSWLIPESSQELDINLMYSPQKKLDKGFKITLLTLPIMTVLMIFVRLKNKRKK